MTPRAATPPSVDLATHEGSSATGAAVELPQLPERTSPIWRMLRGSSIYGFGNILTQAIAFLLIPIYTRYLTPADYGVLATVRAIGSIVLLVFTLDLGTAVSRYYFEYRTDMLRLRRYLGTISVFLLGSSLLLTGLGLLGGPWLMRLWLPGERIPFHPYLSLTLWSTYFGVATVVPLTLLQMRERPVSYVALTAGRFLLNTLAILYFVVVRHEGALGSIKGTFVADGACFVIFTVMTMRQVTLAFEWAPLWHSLALSLPMVPHLLAHWVLTLSDRLLLQRLAPMADVGIYALGYNFGMVMAFIVTAFNASWVPIYYDLALHDRTPLQTLGRLSTSAILVLSLIAAAGILFSREAVLLAASPTYAAAQMIVPLVILAYLFNGLYLFPVNSLFLRKDTRWLPVFTILAALLNVGLNFWWIPRAGAMGAAWATLVAYAVLFLLVFSYAHAKFPVAYDYGRIGIGLATVGLMAAVAAWWPAMGLGVSLAWKGGVLAGLLCWMWRAGVIRRLMVPRTAEVAEC